MSEILAIAESVWRRILKMKVVYFLIACAIVEISVTTLYEVLMMSEQRMLMVDLSLLLTTMSGLLVVLSLAFDVPKELREGGAATLLSKPVGRVHYLVGKFVGIAVVGLIVTSLVSIGFCCVHHFAFDQIPISAVKGHVLAIASVVPMSAIAVFFSALLNETMAAIFTALAIWAAHSTGAFLSNVRVIYGGILPDMNLFNLRAEATYNIVIDWRYIAGVGGWGIVYSIALIAFTGIIFNYRDLK